MSSIFEPCKYPKGQLISELIFCVFKSPQKPTKFLTDFCPSFIDNSSKRLPSFEYMYYIYCATKLTYELPSHDWPKKRVLWSLDEA